MRSLASTKNALQVTWRDGVQSIYPSDWLRATVRDDCYFEPVSLLYKPEHLSFVTKASTMTKVEGDNDTNTIHVHWDDHSSAFDSSWLRAQDTGNHPPSLKANGSLKTDSERVSWDSSGSIPEYSYRDREDQFESWMSDIRTFGAILMHDVPQDEKTFREVLNLIGPLWQRYHPTYVFKMKTTKKALSLDYHSYGLSYLDAHTDTTYYTKSAKLQALLCVEYSAPKEDTVNFIADAVKVAEDIKKEDEEAFELLTNLVAGQARLRFDVEEPRPDSAQNKYKWSARKDSPMLVINKEGEVIENKYLFPKHVGFSLDVDNATMQKAYNAYHLFDKKVNDPFYQKQYVMKPGMMQIFDNQRLLHGRGPIHPTTSRTLLGAYLPEDIWKSRWRLLYGRKSGLEKKWLVGCSDEVLQVLAQRII